MKGKFKGWVTGRDFGFIIPDEAGPDVFVHRSNVQPVSLAKLLPGQLVSFDLRTGAKGKPEAINVAVETPQALDGTAGGSDADPALASLSEAQMAEPVPAVQQNVPPLEESGQGIPDEAAEIDETASHSKWGTVKRFDKQKGSGHITPNEGGDTVFVLFRNIAGMGYKTLFQNEQVLYDIDQDKYGKPWAVNVRPAPVPVSNGKIVTFDEDSEQGQIQPNEGGEPVRFSAEGVFDKDLSEYEQGDLVKYRLVQSDSGLVPVRITRLVDPRLPLERFADLSDFDRLLALRLPLKKRRDIFPAVL